MTMHLVRGMTTTNFKKRKTKNKSKKQLEADAKHEKWLRKMNAHPDPIKENKKKMLVFRSPVSLIIAVTVILSLLVMLFGGRTVPLQRQIYPMKEDYWASR